MSSKVRNVYDFLRLEVNPDLERQTCDLVLLIHEYRLRRTGRRACEIRHRVRFLLLADIRRRRRLYGLPAPGGRPVLPIPVRYDGGRVVTRFLASLGPSHTKHRIGGRSQVLSLVQPGGGLFRVPIRSCPERSWTTSSSGCAAVPVANSVAATIIVISRSDSSRTSTGSRKTRVETSAPISGASTL